MNNSKGKRRRSKKGNPNPYTPKVPRDPEGRFMKEGTDNRKRNEFCYRPEIEGRNDFSWYNRNPSLTVAAASLPFPYRPGMVLPLSAGGGYTDKRIPGVASMLWAPFVGVGGTSTDPINVASREIFNKVRNAFSGSIEADSPDFVMYLVALDSMFSYIGGLKRIYRVVNAYTPMNYAIPNALMYGMGFTEAETESIRKDRVKLWQYINELVAMTRKFVCPAIFPLFNRHYWMNDNVYTDDSTANSQLYVFLQQYHLKFALQGDPAAGGLTYTLFDPSQATGSIVDYLYSYGIDLIQALSNQDDTFIISGYLARAFSGEPSFVVDELQADEVFSPLYIPQVLSQIENSYSPFDFAAGGEMKITLKGVVQDPTTNTVKTDFVLATPGTHQDGMINPYLSLRTDSPTVEDIVEASRLQTFVDWSQSSPASLLIVGTELNLGWRVMPTGQSSMEMVPYIQLTYVDSSTATAPSLVNTIAIRDIASSFDWCPFSFMKIIDGSNKIVSMYGDIHNMTVFSFEQARQINRICLFSEFNAFGINLG